MLDKLLVDLRSPKRPYVVSDDLYSNKLGEYYFLFEEKSVAAGKNQRLIKVFDDDGIPINKTYVDVEDKDYVYFPISIGQMGLAVYHTFLKSGTDEDKVRFLKFAEWFRKNVTETEELGAVWYTDVDLPAYKRKGPWQSAFSQSRAISILLRGYQLTNNEEYQRLAKLALLSFKVEVKDGGVMADTAFGPFYEEYTSHIHTLVLNGHIFALCGVYDFVRTFPDDQEAREIFDKGVQTTVKILPEFDLGFWSRYNLCNAEFYPDVDPSTIGYQKLHATQLEFMYKLTNNPIFKTFMEKFENQISLLNIARMYKLKYNALKKIGRL